jgi:hypothetical protein
MDPITISALIAGFTALGGSIIEAATDEEEKTAPPPASSPGYVEQAPATRVPDQATVDEEANRIVYGEAIKARDELKTFQEEEDELAAAPAV